MFTYAIMVFLGIGETEDRLADDELVLDDPEQRTLAGNLFVALGQIARHAFRISDPVLKRSTRPTGVSSPHRWGASIPPSCNSTG